MFASRRPQNRARMANPTAHALVSHVLRRLTFGPSPETVDRFANGASSPEEAAKAAIDWALKAPARPLTPATVTGDDGWDLSPRGWTDSMRAKESGLHEKLTFFWHGHLPSSTVKVGNITMLHQQQGLLRSHAAGSYRKMLREMITNPVMLLYLDGAGSNAEAPNENMARELMELFTLGRGIYTEADVKAGALALSGWDVDYETGKTTYNPERGLGGEVVFLGKRGRFGVDDIANILLDHPACAPHVASKLYAYLCGLPPTKERAAELGKVFRSADYEIMPLVENIVWHPEFLSMRLNRPRYPVEWWVSMLAAYGEPREGEKIDTQPWQLKELDQMPYEPPNVAGWPPGPKWLSASQMLTRQAYSWGVSWVMRPFGGRDLVAATLKRCSIHECSAATRTALQDAALATAGSADALSVSRRLMTVAVTSPEFALA